METSHTRREEQSRMSDNGPPAAPLRVTVKPLVKHLAKKKGLRSNNFQRKIRVNEFFYQAYVNPFYIPLLHEDKSLHEDWETQVATSPFLSETYNVKDIKRDKCNKTLDAFSRCIPFVCGHDNIALTNSCDSLCSSYYFRAYSHKLFDDTVSCVGTFFDAMLAKKFIDKTEKLSHDNDMDMKLKSKKLGHDIKIKPCIPQSTICVSPLDETSHLKSYVLLPNTFPLPDSFEEKKTSDPALFLARRQHPCRNFRGSSQQLHEPFDKQEALHVLEKCQYSLSTLASAVQTFTEHVLDVYENPTSLTDKLITSDTIKPLEKLPNCLSGSHEFLVSRHRTLQYETPFCFLDCLSWDAELYRRVTLDIAALVQLRASQGGTLSVEDCWNHRKLIAYLVKKNSSTLYESPVTLQDMSLSSEISDYAQSAPLALWQRITHQLNQQDDPLQIYRLRSQALAKEFNQAALIQRTGAQVMREALCWALSKPQSTTQIPQIAPSHKMASSIECSPPIVTQETNVTVLKETIKTHEDTFLSLCQQFKYYAFQVSRVGLWKNQVRALYCSGAHNESRCLLEDAIRVFHRGLELQKHCNIAEELALLKEDIEKCVSFQQLLLEKVPGIFQNHHQPDFIAQPATYQNLVDFVGECEMLPFIIPGCYNLTTSIKDSLTWQMMAAAAVSSQDLDRCKDLLKNQSSAVVQLSGIKELRSDVVCGEWIESLSRISSTKKPLSLTQFESILCHDNLELLHSRFLLHPMVKELVIRCQLAIDWIQKLYHPTLYSLLTVTDISEMNRVIVHISRLFSLYDRFVTQDNKSIQHTALIELNRTCQQSLYQLNQMKEAVYLSETFSSKTPTKNDSMQPTTELCPLADTCASQSRVSTAWNEAQSKDVLNFQPVSKTKESILEKKHSPYKFLNSIDSPFDCFYEDSREQMFQTSYHLVSVKEIFAMCESYFSIRLVLSAFTTLDAFRQKIKRWKKHQLCAVSGRNTVCEQDVVALIKEGYHIGWHVDLRDDIHELVLVLHSYRLWAHRVDSILKGVARLLSQADVTKASNHLMSNASMYQSTHRDDSITQDLHEALPIQVVDTSCIESLDDLLKMNLDRPSMDEITSLCVQHTESSIIDVSRGNKLFQLKDVAERWRRRARDLLKSSKNSTTTHRLRVQLLVEARYLAVNVMLEEQMKIDFFLFVWRQSLSQITIPFEESKLRELYHLPVEKKFVNLLHSNETLLNKPIAAFQDYVFIGIPGATLIPYIPPFRRTVLKEACQQMYETLIQQFSERDILTVLMWIQTYWTKTICNFSSMSKLSSSQRYTLDDWEHMSTILSLQPISCVSCQHHIHTLLEKASTLIETLNTLPNEICLNDLKRLEHEMCQSPVCLPQYTFLKNFSNKIETIQAQIDQKIRIQLHVNTAEEELRSYLESVVQECKCSLVTLNPASLPEYLNLENRLQRIVLWNQKYKQVDTSCWSYDEWQALIEEASELYVTCDDLNALKEKLSLSQNWLKLHAYLVTLCYPSDANDNVQYKKKKISLPFAQLLIAMKIGLVHQLAVFKKLEDNMKEIYLLQKECLHLFQLSQQQFDQDYISILAHACECNELEKGGPSISDETDVSESMSPGVMFFSILNVTCSMKKLLDQLQQIETICLPCVEWKLSMEIEKRHVCLQLLVCLWSTCTLSMSNVTIPFHVARDVVFRIENWNPIMPEKCKEPVLDFADIRSFFKGVDISWLVSFQKTYDQTQIVRKNQNNFAALDEYHMPCDLPASILTLCNILKERVNKSQKWIDSFELLIQTPHFSNLYTQLQTETKTTTFTWPTTLEQYYSFFALKFNNDHLHESSATHASLHMNTSRAKYIPRQPTSSSFLTTRKISLHTRVVDLFHDISSTSQLTLGQVLHEKFIKRLDEFRRNHDVHSFKLTLDESCEQTRCTQHLLFPYFIVQYPNETPLFVEEWKKLFPHMTLNAQKDSVLWKTLCDTVSPTIQDAIQLLQRCEKELFFKINKFDTFYLAVALFLVLLQVIEYEFPYECTTNCFTASRYIKANQRYTCITQSAMPVTYSALEGLELVELLDLSLFQSHHKNHIIQLMFQSFLYHWNASRIIFLLPPLDETLCKTRKDKCEHYNIRWLQESLYQALVGFKGSQKESLFLPTLENVELKPCLTKNYIEMYKETGFDRPTDTFILIRSALNFNDISELKPRVCGLCGVGSLMMLQEHKGPWVICHKCDKTFHTECAGLSYLNLPGAAYDVVDVGTFECSLCLTLYKPTDNDELCNRDEEVFLLLTSRWFCLWSQDWQKNVNDSLSACISTTRQEIPSLSSILIHAFTIPFSQAFQPMFQLTHKIFHRLLLWCLKVCILFLTRFQTTHTIFLKRFNNNTNFLEEQEETTTNNLVEKKVSVNVSTALDTKKNCNTDILELNSKRVSKICFTHFFCEEKNSGIGISRAKKRKQKKNNQIKSVRPSLKGCTWKKNLEHFQKRRPRVFSSFLPNESIKNSTHQQKRLKPSFNKLEEPFVIDLRDEKKIMDWFSEALTTENVEKKCTTFIEYFLKHTNNTEQVCFDTFLQYYKENKVITIQFQQQTMVCEITQEHELTFQCLCFPTLETLAQCILEGIFLGVQHIPFLSLLMDFFKKCHTINESLNQLVTKMEKESFFDIACFPLPEDTNYYNTVLKNFTFTTMTTCETSLSKHPYLFELPSVFSLITFLKSTTQNCYHVLQCLCQLAPLSHIPTLHIISNDTFHSLTSTCIQNSLTLKYEELHKSLLYGRMPQIIIDLFELSHTLEDLKRKIFQCTSTVYFENDIHRKASSENSSYISGSISLPTDTLELEKYQKKLLKTTEVTWDLWLTQWKKLIQKTNISCCVELVKQETPLENFYYKKKQDNSTVCDTEENHQHGKNSILCHISSKTHVYENLYYFEETFHQFKLLVDKQNLLLQQASAIYAAIITHSTFNLDYEKKQLLTTLKPSPCTQDKLFTVEALGSLLDELYKGKIHYQHFETLKIFHATEKTFMLQLYSIKEQTLKQDKKFLTQEEYTRWIRAMKGTICCWGDVALWFKSCSEKVEQWIDKTRNFVKETLPCSTLSQETYHSSLAYALSLKKEMNSFIVDFSKTNLLSDLRRIIRELRSYKKNSVREHKTHHHHVVRHEEEEEEEEEENTSQIARRAIKRSAHNLCKTSKKSSFSKTQGNECQPCSSPESSKKTQTTSCFPVVTSETSSINPSLFMLPLYNSTTCQVPSGSPLGCRENPTSRKTQPCSEYTPASLPLTHHSSFSSIFPHLLQSTFTVNNTMVPSTNFYSNNPSNRLFDFTYHQPS